MERRHLALFIGNSIFDNADTFTNLHAPANDVYDFARVLEKYGDFETFGILIDETSTTISRAIDDLFSEVERGDLVLLYYSGHGYRDEKNNYYLVTKNSQLDRMRTTSIPAFFIHDVMRGGRSRHIVIILDCCFSGAFIEGQKGVELLSLEQLKGKAEVILTSSNIVQLSFEEDGRSLFTHYLLKGIETGEAGANNIDGYIFVDELFDYADVRVRKARKDQPDKPDQTPMIKMSTSGGKIIIARNPKRSTAIELNFPNAVRNEKDFYGRRTEIEQIERAFLAGSGRSVIILGERRIGKTSLQAIMAKRLVNKEDGHFILLSLPSPTAILSWQEYATEILQSLCSRLGKSLQEIDLVDKKGYSLLTTFGQVMDAITHLLQNESDKIFIICIDEFDVFFHKLASIDKVEAGKILGLTDLIIEKGDLPLAVFFTMTHLPESVKDSVRSPGISKSEVIPLGPFSPQEMEEMVFGLLGKQVVLDQHALKYLFRLSGGHPYFVKLLLDHLLTHYRPAGTVLSVTQDMIEQIVPDAVSDIRVLHVLDNLYRVHFNSQERALLLLLVDRRIGITAEKLKILENSLLTAAKRLDRRGYLVRNEKDNYDFRIEFLRWWFRDWERYEEECDDLAITTLSQTLEIERQKLETDIQIDKTMKQIWVKDKFIKSTPQDYQILTLLYQHAGKVVSKDRIAEELWPEAKGAVTDDSIYAAIHRLRGKLGDKRYIETVSGQGFILHLRIQKERS